MERQIAISIIVPVYNMEKYLSRCVDSLLNQTFQNIQIILVDDCSTDNSLDIERQYKEKYPEQIVLCQTKKNSKQGAARNLGLNYAEGEYIMYVDSDDWLEEKACENLINRAFATNADIVYGMYQEVTEDGTIKSIKACVFEEQLKDDYGLLMLNPHYPVAKIIRKEIICENNLFFPENIFFEDITTGPLYVYYANKIEFVEDVCYNYLQRETSVMHAMSVERVQQEIRCAELFLQECKDRGIYGEMPEIVIGKFFISACVLPYVHSGRAKDAILRERIQSILHLYEREFLECRYIGFMTEQYLIDELLPQYKEVEGIKSSFVERMKDDSALAVWGAGVKGKDFVFKYGDSVDISYVIDKKESLHGTFMESGQEIISIEKCVDMIETILVVNSNYYYDIQRELANHNWNKQLINYESIIRTIIYNSSVPIIESINASDNDK